MINLLPPQEKEAIHQQAQQRLAIVLSVIAVICAICLSLILIALKFYLLQSINSNKIILEDAQKKYQTSEFLSFKIAVQKDNQELSQISNFYRQQVSFSQVIEDIAHISKPKGVMLTSINVDGTNPLKVTLSGSSDTRDDLITFKNNLEATSTLKNVSFPPESWINTTNVTFSVTFELPSP